MPFEAALFHWTMRCIYCYCPDGPEYNTLRYPLNIGMYIYDNSTTISSILRSRILECNHALQVESLTHLTGMIDFSPLHAVLIDTAGVSRTDIHYYASAT